MCSSQGMAHVELFPDHSGVHFHVTFCRKSIPDMMAGVQHHREPFMSATFHHSEDWKEVEAWLSRNPVIEELGIAQHIASGCGFTFCS